MFDPRKKCEVSGDIVDMTTGDTKTIMAAFPFPL